MPLIELDEHFRPRPRAERRPRQWLILGEWTFIAIALLPLIWQLGLVLPHMPWTATSGSDYAGLERDARSALGGHQLLGTSSRLGVRNIGPAHAYWLAPWYSMWEGVGGMVVGAWVLNAVAIVAVVLIVRSVAGRRSAAAAALALCLLWLRAGPEALSDFYNPALTVPMMLLGTVAAAAVATGAWRFLPVAAAAAAAGAQLHFAGAPGIGVVSVLAVAIGFRRARPTWQVLAATGLVLAVFFAPTVIDQASASGNLGDLTSAIVKGPGTPDQPLGRPSKAGPLGDRAGTAVELATLTASNASAHGMLSGISYGRPRPSPLRIGIGTVLLAAAVVLALLTRRRLPFASILVAFGLAGTLTTYLLTARLERGFLPYYLTPIVGFALAMGVGCALGLAALVDGRVQPASDTARSRAWLSVAAGVVCITVAISAINGNYGRLNVLKITEPAGYQIHFANRVASALPSKCRDRGVALKVPVVQLNDMWILMVALDKQGIHTTVPGSLERAAGSGHERTGREAVIVKMPDPFEFNSRAIPPGSIVVRGC